MKTLQVQPYQDGKSHTGYLRHNRTQEDQGNTLQILCSTTTRADKASTRMPLRSKTNLLDKGCKVGHRCQSIPVSTGNSRRLHVSKKIQGDKECTRTRPRVRTSRPYKHRMELLRHNRTRTDPASTQLIPRLTSIQADKVYTRTNLRLNRCQLHREHTSSR